MTDGGGRDPERWAQAEMLAAEHGIPVADVFVVLNTFRGDAALASGYIVEIRGKDPRAQAKIASVYLQRAWSEP